MVASADLLHLPSRCPTDGGADRRPLAAVVSSGPGTDQGAMTANVTARSRPTEKSTRPTPTDVCAASHVWFPAPSPLPVLGHTRAQQLELVAEVWSVPRVVASVDPVGRRTHGHGGSVGAAALLWRSPAWEQQRCLWKRVSHQVS